MFLRTDRSSPLISRVALVTSLGNLVANIAQSADEGPGPRDAAGARCPRAPSQASPTRLLFRLSSRICEKGRRLFWSQIRGRGTNVVVPRLEGIPCNDVHSDAQDVLQILEQTDVIKEGRAWLEIHEAI